MGQIDLIALINRGVSFNAGRGIASCQSVMDRLGFLGYKRLKYKELNMKINLENKICRAEGKISTELDGETVILDMESGVYVGLDAIGTQVWSLIEDNISFESLLEKLMEDYDVGQQHCLEDMQLFLTELVDSGLIVVQ